MDERILAEIEDEMGRAEAAWPDYHSAHEGWAVLYEEVCELFEAVRLPEGEDLVASMSKMDYRKARMREEAIQVAATAIRFIRNCCS